MASNDDTTNTPPDSVTSNNITINVKGPSELKIQLAFDTDKTVSELKDAIAKMSNVEAEYQRLIYSGRVLKDEEQLSIYKIRDGHTIHMVKGARRSESSSSGTGAARPSPSPLPTMQTGQDMSDPLTLLNSHLGFGSMAGINPFADLGLNATDPNMMLQMLNNPQFLGQITTAVTANPEIMDEIIASDPQFLESELLRQHFRQVVSNPEQLRQVLQIASMFPAAGGLGLPRNAFPAPGIPSSFLPPGVPTTAPLSTLNAASATGAPNTSSTGASAPTGPANPSGIPPAVLRHLLAGIPHALPDQRPAEERFSSELEQLRNMGFTNAAQNVRALLASGGNVHSAIEYILDGNGI